MTDKLLATGDKVIVKPIKEDVVTDSGLQLMQHTKLPRGIVVHAGMDVYDPNIEVGSKIVYRSWAQVFLNITEEYHVVEHKDIQGIIVDAE